MRVVIAEDSVLLREGVARLLEDEGHEVVGRAGDAVELIAEVERHTPDVAVVDVRMPPTHTDEGLKAALLMRQRWPAMGVLVLSQYVEERYATELLTHDAGGIGYLLKDRVARVEEFMDALERVSQGGTALDPVVIRQLFARSKRTDPLSTLTERESRVLSLMAEGHTNDSIARQVYVSSSAVEKHVNSIFRKLGLDVAEGSHRRILAVVHYLKS
ncbi:MULTISPECIES: response regulator [Streptomyces]|uniref:DNA-binding response regulator, NarL/FixJ family, contains REC and HTH domains n=2 Tax=Streptomyces TaxID=1883 RepID=A0A1I6R099_9ACTN|nr:MULTISPECIES: response regulator transcription factor [Streptomyces]MCK1813978.1 response regulator transcription factor [Streptomyces sp. XM4011]QKV67603.1 response regulator transcription factor [Streptomyces harbinensis]UWM47892.1 response regulator transcription factor [Streptomyces carpaticus]SFS58083.1 DNA-binding response regulator, NarL/FixJ family, contains REC and HTH domains [Streptomyces harbinensis]